MDAMERLEKIKSNLKSNAYFVNPLSDANVKDDLSFLLSLLEQKDGQIQQQEKKIRVLANQVMELTQEIEAVKADFGDMR